METGNNTKITWQQMFCSLRGLFPSKATVKKNAIGMLYLENRAYWTLIALFFFFIAFNGLFSRTEKFHWRADVNHAAYTQIHSVFLSVTKKTFKEYLVQAKNYEQITSSPEFWELPLVLMDSIPSASPLKRNAFFLSSAYGLRRHPIKESKTLHNGVDLATVQGTPIFSSAAGTVIQLGYEPKGYGYFVRIKHSFGFETLYGHLSEVVLKAPTEIRSQQLIGYSGNTGFSTGPHLHYEVIKNGKAIDPIPSFGMKYKMFEQRLRTLTN
ncbi:M23 family metallopeptidase [Maribacter arenosus]|uniref:M23 family metallopeptidase n=1 Tax=Maribacter arenosus TaxID=1854708 RepID=A0ABR7VF45_9FLAO|nr:M23 family metallopeptidase [Maribacter arenosus]MBD0851931.1 M23 family metallopeptidase [Maribacter arenosus]